MINTKPFVYMITCKECKKRYTPNCPMYHIREDGWMETYIIKDMTKDDGYCHQGESKENAFRNYI